MKFDICYNMDDPWRHCAKWNKPDTKGINIVWFHLCKIPRKRKKWKRDRNGISVGSMVVRGTENDYLMDTKFQFDMSFEDG
jgi:hypothetical protein